jgi:hypothetical protein
VAAVAGEFGTVHGGVTAEPMPRSVTAESVATRTG